MIMDCLFRRARLREAYAAGGCVMWEQQLRDLAARGESAVIPCGKAQKQQLADMAHRIGKEAGVGTQTDTAKAGMVEVTYTRPASKMP